MRRISDFFHFFAIIFDRFTVSAEQQMYAKPQQRNRSPSIHITPTTFKLSISWKFSADASAPCLMRIQSPQCFPQKQSSTKISLQESESKTSTTISALADDHFIESALRVGFTFLISFSFDPISQSPKPHRRTQEKPPEEQIALDASKLFVPSFTSCSVSAAPSRFSSFDFSVSIDRSLIPESTMRKLTPSFLHILKVDSLPERRESQYPTFAKVSVAGSSFSILASRLNDSVIIDTVIPIVPRAQQTVSFEIHDCPTSFPSDGELKGSGLIRSKKPAQNSQPIFLDIEEVIAMPTRSPCGLCSFQLLPERKEKVPIIPERGTSFIISPSNFHEAGTVLVFKVYDPAAGFEPVKSKPPAVKAHLKPISQPENADLRYRRWLMFSEFDSNEPPFFCSLSREIVRHHMAVLSESNISVIQTYNYEIACEKSEDVITGFVLRSPKETVTVLEAMENGIGARIIDKFTSDQLYGAKSIHILSSNELSFPHPRLYCSFHELIKEVRMPVSIRKLILNDGIYTKRSPLYVLFHVAQVLHQILGYKSLSEASELPSSEDIICLLSRSELLGGAIEVPPPPRAPRLDPVQSRLQMSFSVRRIGLEPEMVRQLAKSGREIREEEQKRPKTSRSKPRFCASGRKIEQKSSRLQRDQINVSKDGETEIWKVGDPESLISEGWELEVLHTSRRSQSKQSSKARADRRGTQEAERSIK